MRRPPGTYTMAIKLFRFRYLKTKQNKTHNTSKINLTLSHIMNYIDGQSRSFYITNYHICFLRILLVFCCYLVSKI